MDSGKEYYYFTKCEVNLFCKMQVNGKKIGSLTSHNKSTKLLLYNWNPA